MQPGPIVTPANTRSAIPGLHYSFETFEKHYFQPIPIGKRNCIFVSV